MGFRFERVMGDYLLFVVVKKAKFAPKIGADDEPCTIQQDVNEEEPECENIICH